MTPVSQLLHQPWCWVSVVQRCLCWVSQGLLCEEVTHQFREAMYLWNLQQKDLKAIFRYFFPIFPCDLYKLVFLAISLNF